MNTPVNSTTITSSSQVTLQSPSSPQKVAPPKGKIPLQVVFAALALLLLIIGAVVAFYLSTRKQEIRQQASGGTCEYDCGVKYPSKSGEEFRLCVTQCGVTPVDECPSGSLPTIGGKCQCTNGDIIAKTATCPTSSGSCYSTSDSCTTTANCDTSKYIFTSQLECKSNLAPKCESGSTEITSGTEEGACKCANGKVVEKGEACSTGGALTCPSGATPITGGVDAGACKCPSGAIVNKGDKCTAIIDDKTCAAGSIEITGGVDAGGCKCANGYIVNKGEACSTSGGGTTCPTGSTPITGGVDVGACKCTASGKTVEKGGTCLNGGGGGGGGTPVGDVTCVGDTGVCTSVNGQPLSSNAEYRKMLGYYKSSGTGSCDYFDKCAPQVPTGGTCDGRKRLSVGEPSHGGFVGCSGTLNCFCGAAYNTKSSYSSSDGNVQCYTDVGNDSCGGGGTGGSCSGALQSCEGGATCCSGFVCQGTMGSRKCQDAGKPKDQFCPGAVCGGTGGWIGFRCDHLTNGQCLDNPQTFNDYGSAAAYAGSCGQADEVCNGGSNNRNLCGGFTVFSSGCSGPPVSSPTPPPTNPPGPVCLNVTASKTKPQLNDSITFTCGQVNGANHYEFRIKSPDGKITNLSATGNVSQAFKVTKPGKHSAQCRICTGADASTCQGYESL